MTYAGIQVPWTITSDSRFKSNIQTSALGLEFIKQLRPVSYYRNNDESKKTEYGFVAQEVEQTLNKAGIVNNGIISKDDAGMYSVRYNDFIAPMVKAIQQQQEMIEALKKQNELLAKRLAIIEKERK
ncbi:tail fiber domain-containing protein [Ferruginibacter sp.]